MKRIATTLALSLLTASVAMANGHRGDENRHDGRSEQPHAQDHRADRRDGREDRRDFVRNDRREDRRDFNRDRDWREDRRDFNHRDRDYRSDRFERFHAGEYRRPWGYRDARWQRGDWLPRAYYARPYVLTNYGYYRLRPPPRYTQWVRVNQDVVLAEIATGLVLDVVYDYFG